MVQWDEEQITRAKADFRVFLFMVWRVINLPNPTPIQYDIAKTLQNPPGRRTILEGFRGVAKSYIACAFCVWLLWNDPELKVLVVSASKDRADANAVFIRKILLLMPFLEHLKPDENSRNTQNAFDVGGISPSISTSVKSVGISSQITGTRADYLLADDVEVSNNSGTQGQRDKLSEAVKEFDAILKPGGNILFLGTPQNEMSVYNQLQKRGYKTIIYPIIYPEDEQMRNDYIDDEFGDRLAPFIAEKFDNNPSAYAGSPTDPSRFDEEDIAERKLSYGKAGFYLQFLLNTQLSDAEKYPLKVSDLIIDSLELDKSSILWSWSNAETNRLKELPCVGLKGDAYYSYVSRSNDVVPYTSIIMYIDPSGRGKDETAYAILAFLNGYLFLLDVGGYTEGYETSVLRNLANKCKLFKVNHVLVEPNFGNGMFAQLFRPVLQEVYPHCVVSDAPAAKSQKEARIIDTLEPVMMRHKLIVNYRVIEEDYKVYVRDEKYSLIYQMTRLSRERGALAHDDRLDALAGAVAYFLDMVSLPEKAGQEQLIDEELEKWFDPDFGVIIGAKKPDPDKMAMIRKGRKIPPHNDCRGLNVIRNIAAYSKKYV